MVDLLFGVDLFDGVSLWFGFGYYSCLDFVSDLLSLV